MRRASSRAARASGGRGHPSRLRLPRRERGLRGGLHRRRLHLRRPARAEHRAPWVRRSSPRRAWRAAGVPLLPGYAGEQQDLEHLGRAARAAGLPLIVKPAAGGGGKGMQIVRREAEIAPALAAARRLAESAFGDGALLLERYLEAPRHIEVQVFADRHGNYVHLGERDCSIQRRHQKLIEEAPAPRAAARGARSGCAPRRWWSRARSTTWAPARSSSSTTPAEFYFMEMNTRLQVEHTVTEAITGLDLVEWQLRVAAGERLPLAAGGDPLQRACDRGARLRRGSAARLPAERRGTRAPGVARGRTRAGGCRLRQRGPRPGDLRLAPRQGDRLGRDARGRPRRAWPRRSMPPTAWACTATSTGWRACCAMSASWACGTASPSSMRPAASSRPPPPEPAALVLAALAQLLPGGSPRARRPEPLGAARRLHPEPARRSDAALQRRCARTHRVELQFQDGRPAGARVDGGTALRLHEVSRRGTHAGCAPGRAARAGAPLQRGRARAPVDADRARRVRCSMTRVRSSSRRARRPAGSPRPCRASWSACR